MQAPRRGWRSSPTRALAHIATIPAWEKVTMVLILVLGCGTPVNRLRDLSGEVVSSQTVVDGDPIVQLIWGALNILVLGLLYRTRLASGAWRTLVSLAPILLIACASLGWSESPAATFRRLAALGGTTLIGYYVGNRFGRQGLFQLVRATLGVGALLSLLVGLFAPQFGAPDDGWSGIFLQKNWLGRMMALSSIVWLMYGLGRRRSLGLSACVLLVSLALVVLSNSATGLVLTGALAGSLFLLSRYSTALLLWVVAAAGLALMWMAGQADTLTGVLGRDATLSGRVQLWDVVLAQIARAPWLGHGYGAFWLGWDGPSAVVWRAVYWLPPHAHNGFLDILLDLGVVGLAAFLFSLIWNFARALTVLTHERRLSATFPLVFLLFLVLSNLTESWLLIHNSFAWIVYVALTVALSRPPEAAASGSSLDRPASVTQPAWLPERARRRLLLDGAQARRRGKWHSQQPASQSVP